MNVHREREELVRKAAGYVDDSINSFAHSYDYKDQQDLLAMIALQNVVGMMELEEKKDFREKEMELKLKEIDKVLSNQLSME
jgi:cell division protein ZapA